MKTTGARSGPRKRPSRTKPAKQFYEFDLAYAGSVGAYDEIERTLAEAGRDDILLAWQDGAYHLSVSKEAPSFRIALMSAITDIECLGLGLELIHVEPIRADHAS